MAALHKATKPLLMAQTSASVLIRHLVLKEKQGVSPHLTQPRNQTEAFLTMWLSDRFPLRWMNHISRQVCSHSTNWS